MLKDEEEGINHERIESVRRSYIRWDREQPHSTMTREQFVEPHCSECRVILITGICSICQQILTTEYPNDYPNEFKFCCSCLQWAKSIVADKNAGWLIYALKFSPTIKKIYERITVLGCEKRKE